MSFKKVQKVRTSVWVDPRLTILLQLKGMTLSGFISKALPAFLKLPDDERDRLLDERMQGVMIQVREDWEKEQQELDLEAEVELTEAQRERAREVKRLAPIIAFGELFTNCSNFAALIKDFVKLDPEPTDRTWAAAVMEINAMSEHEYTISEAWNFGLLWWSKFGKEIHS